MDIENMKMSLDCMWINCLPYRHLCVKCSLTSNIYVLLQHWQCAGTLWTLNCALRGIRIIRLQEVYSKSWWPDSGGTQSDGKSTATMAGVNRLTCACVPHSLLAALLLPCTSPGVERRKATEQSKHRGSAGMEVGKQRAWNPWVINLKWGQKVPKWSKMKGKKFCQL